MNSFEHGFNRGFKHGEKHSLEYVLMLLDVYGDDSKAIREHIEKEKKRVRESIRNED